MPSNSTWVPDENAHILFAERCWLQGAIISAIAYGITVSLYSISFSILIRRKKNRGLRKGLPLLIYITLSFILGTIFMISYAANTQMAFIDDRNYPGGPNGFETTTMQVPVSDVGNVTFVLSSWLCDALVVWRFKVIYQTQHRLPIWIVMLFPCLMFVASFAIGIMYLIQLLTTGVYVANGVNFTLPYISLSLALNIILTIAIVLRLLSFRHRIVSVFGSGYGTQYTSIAAMVIESAALYSAVSITFLALFGVGNAVSQVLTGSLPQFQIISTQLIVFRVAQGKGWTEDVATRVVTVQRSEPLELDRVQFSSPGASLSQANSGEIVKNASGVFQDGPHIHISTDTYVMRDIA